METGHRQIGGEFEFDINRLNNLCNINNQSSNSLYHFSSGRAALYNILLDIKSRHNIQSILFPDYLCSSLLTAAQRAEVPVTFYELNRSLELDENFFIAHYDESSVVLIINYFGLQDLSRQISFIKSVNANAIIIEDDVQAYFEFQTPLGDTEYKFTSLRKTFAIPDGGLVKSRHPLKEPSIQNKFHQYKIAGSILKAFRESGHYEDEVYLSLFSEGESFIDGDITLGISGVAMDILANTDITKVANARKNNACYIISMIKSLGIEPILNMKRESVPLFVPIWVDDRDKVRRYMFQHDVYCPIHWPLDGMKIKKGAEMDKHELSIIVDQRYSTDDMGYIVSLLKDAIS